MAGHTLRPEMQQYPTRPNTPQYALPGDETNLEFSAVGARYECLLCPHQLAV